MSISNFFSLNFQDALKGAITAAFTAILSAAYTSLNEGHLPTGAELKTIAIIGLTAGVGYIVKNLVTNNEGKLFKADVKEAPQPEVQP